MTELVSKPKIHRLPALPAQTGGLASLENAAILRSLWAFGAVGMLVLSFSFYQHYATESPSDAQIKALAAMAPAAAPDLSGSSIYIKGSEGTIVGQMAKIPPEREKMTDLKNAIDVNKGTGQDLLAIISKY